MKLVKVDINVAIHHINFRPVYSFKDVTCIMISSTLTILQNEHNSRNNKISCSTISFNFWPISIHTKGVISLKYTFMRESRINSFWNQHENWKILLPSFMIWALQFLHSAHESCIARLWRYKINENIYGIHIKRRRQSWTRTWHFFSPRTK